VDECEPLVAVLQAALGQPRRRALAVDKCLAVRGAEGVYSLGDCADVKSDGTELLDHAAALFKQGLTLVHFSARPEPFLTL